MASPLHLSTNPLWLDPAVHISWPPYSLISAVINSWPVYFICTIYFPSTRCHQIPETIAFYLSHRINSVGLGFQTQTCIWTEGPLLAIHLGHRFFLTKANRNGPFKFQTSVEHGQNDFNNENFCGLKDWVDTEISDRILFSFILSLGLVSAFANSKSFTSSLALHPHACTHAHQFAFLDNLTIS